MVAIHIKPDFMIDEPLDISVTGLEKGAKITLGLFLNHDLGKFSAHGHYIADSHGNIKLDEECSVGGTYYGLEPMGLFWSMEPLPGQRPVLNYYHKDTTKSEMLHLTVHEGHLSTEDLMKTTPVTKVTVRRHAMSDDVERIEINQHGFVGVVYKPKGNGTFPGVVHIYGQTPVVWDILACRLASQGFAAFHLFYLHQAYLPKSLGAVKMDYFFKAVDWFCKEPYVKEGGIQGVGQCAGATLLLFLASKLPNKIISVVDINGLTLVYGEEGMIPSGMSDLPAIRRDFTKLYKSPDGSLHCKDTYDFTTAPDGAWIKVENIGKLLFIMGEDDQYNKSVECAKYTIKRLQALGKNNYEILQYPGAGHLLEIPYLPLSVKSRYTVTLNNRVRTVVMRWGGKPNAHARAQEHVWKKIREFLLKTAEERVSLKSNL